MQHKFSRPAAFLLGLAVLMPQPSRSAPPSPAEQTGSPDSAEVAAVEVAAVEVAAVEVADGAEVVVERNVPFTSVDGVDLMCDVYRQRVNRQRAADGTESNSKRPAVLVVHGGGWISGDKWTTASYAQSLAKMGIVAVSINYRLAPSNKFPSQVDDVRAALVWLVDHADEYDVDTDRIGMYGYSAGAHLACMLGTLADAPWEIVATTTQWAQGDSRWERMPKLAGIVGGGAPCEFRNLPIDNTAIAYFLGGSRREQPATYRAASPAAHASAGDVPTLFIHGTRDIVVPIASSRVLYEAQRAVGVPSRFLSIEGFGHLLTFRHPTAERATLEFLGARLLGDGHSDRQHNAFTPPHKAEETSTSH